MQAERRMWFNEIAICSVEIPIQEHGIEELIPAQETEIENLTEYNTFEVVKEKNCNKEKLITSRLTVTKKEGNDGQKTKVKAQLLQEDFKNKKNPKVMHQQYWERVIKCY